jgi:hypothetical protein
VTRATGNAFYSQQQRELRRQTQPRRGLRRPEAATYIGVTVEMFDGLVRAGLMPPPKEIAGVAIWDIDAVDLFFTALPEARQRHEGRSPGQ